MKRPSLRFTLRAMLVLTAFIAMLYAFQVRKWSTRRAIVRAIRDNNGFVNDELAGPQWLRNIVTDDDSFRVVSDIEFGPGFSGFDRSNPIGDTQLMAALAPIPRGTSLEYLGLSHTRITDRSAAEISKLKVGKLNLDHTAVTDFGIHQIASMSSLTELDLGGTAVTDAGLRSIADLQGLEELKLNNSAVTDDGISSLVGLSQLQVLDLDGTLISDEALQTIAELKSLSTVVMRNTKVTAAGIQRLRSSRPNCKIGADVGSNTRAQEDSSNAVAFD